MSGDDPLARRLQRAKRELEHDELPRTLRTKAETEARLSRADEQLFADREHARRLAESVAREQQSAAESVELVAEFERRVEHALVAVGRVREMLAGPAMRSEIRYLDRCSRWLRRLAVDVRSDR